MRKFLFVIGMQIAYYLLWSFIALSWNWYTDGTFRGFFILMEILVIGLTVGTICGFDSGKTPEWLKEKTHEQKKYGIKRYIGELHEELRLYGEAMDLQKRINEFKKQK